LGDEKLVCNLNGDTYTYKHENLKTGRKLVKFLLSTLIVTSVTSSASITIKGKWHLRCKRHSVACGFTR
jgi:hypothetical protein